MYLDKTDLENLLYLVPANIEMLEIFAPQEVVRLASIIYTALSEVEAEGFNLSQNFESWEGRARQKITDEILAAVEFFGDTRIIEKFDIVNTLKTFFKFESGDFPQK